MNRFAAPLLVVAVLGLAACGEDADRAARPAPPTAPPVDWEWPAVKASAGDSRFQLHVILRNGPYEAGGGPTLQIQGQVESDDPDLLLSDLYAKLRFVADEGKEQSYDRQRSLVDAASRNVTFFGIDAGPDPKQLTSLEIEVRLVRVKTWTTRTIADMKAGASQRVVLSPFEFSVAAEASGVVVGAYSTDESLAGPKKAWNLLSHAWSAGAAHVADARGVRLEAVGGGGSGGGTSQTYRSRRSSEFKIVYPVTVTVRVPATWDDEVVRYRFTDLDLSKVPPPR